MGFASVVQRERVAEPCLYKYYYYVITLSLSLFLFPVAKGFLSCFKFVTACPVSLLKKCLFGCAKSMAPSVVPQPLVSAAEAQVSPKPTLRRSCLGAPSKYQKIWAVLYIPPVPQKALIQKRHQSHELWDTYTYTPTDKHTHTHINVNSAWEHIFARHLGEVCDVFGQCSALKQLISIDAYRKTERVEDLA